MIRKIIKQGNNSYTITLPIKWVRENGLEEGSEIELNPDNKKLICSTTQERPVKNISLNLKKYDKSLIVDKIIGAYILGYSEISISFDNLIVNHLSKTESIKQTKTLEVIENICNQLIGIEIIDQKENYCLLADFSKSNKKEFNDVLKRVFALIDQMFLDCLKGIQNNNISLLSDLKYKKSNTRKMIYYCLRQIHLNENPDENNLVAQQNIIFCLEQIMETLRLIGKENLNNLEKFNSNLIKIFKEIQFVFREYYYSFYSKKEDSGYNNKIQSYKNFKNLNKFYKSTNSMKEILLASRISTLSHFINKAVSSTQYLKL
jgi:phosphate uptake regulator